MADNQKNASNLAEIAREKNIRYFLISFVDLSGAQRAKLVPASAIDGAVKNGAGFAGFAAAFDMSPADPDLLAMADPSSLIQLPWKPEVAWMASDLVMHGKLVTQAPRNTLKRLVARAKQHGIDVKTGVECEFFLITPDGKLVADEYDAATKPCYDASALMRRYDVIAELCDAMQQLGWEPYQNDHEDANGQFEMNWKYADALVTADRHVFFKFMARSIAEKHGLRATFMPKPFMHLTGSGCHAHISLWKGSENVCYDPKDPLEISAAGYNFVGGLIHNADALCAILNPVVNSYKRINAPRTVSGATWSPNTVTYSGDNRTHMIRVPGGGRFEMRLPDGAANPYLLQASLLAAGLDGIEQKRDPGKPLDINMYTEGHKITEAKRLPLNLLDAMRALDKSTALRGMLDDGLVDPYIKLKQNEWNAHCGHLSEWERTATLDC
ncbi:glutamine synthetase [Acetobacter estunensis NRIC 0472]|uniref:Type III glutamate--ammonia ligase n=1 Tax=Acetobacter estunensis TaxID=104097 RepID=A0A967B9F9_9PROT|nr:type III glutamate--ammonia ligase [Acetobacter estunensis]NHO52893.1 type III glutamate--ammonia ligase [Acetobacter estunensis]GBQ28521.1 glutamine synthetase [Acetobacter estunensis NRIC 0472]